MIERMKQMLSYSRGILFWLETSRLRWHVTETVVEVLIMEYGGPLFPSREAKTEILGIKAVVYPDTAKGELMGASVALENPDKGILYMAEQNYQYYPNESNADFFG